MYMDIVLIVILVIVAIIIGLIVLYIITYNKIQKDMIRIQEAESEIDDSLRKKYDVLISMEEVINEVTKLNQNNFKDFEKDNMSSYDVDRKLTKIADTFNKIRDDYSEELDIDSYRNLYVNLKINNEKCDAAKTYYNKYTTSLNMLIKKFPSNIISRIHGIKEHLYFDNKNMNDEDILDFKI